MSEKKKKINNQSLKHSIEKLEEYNHSIFSNKTSDDVTEQILFCQNSIDNLNVSSKNTNSISVRFLSMIYFVWKFVSFSLCN